MRLPAPLIAATGSLALALGLAVIPNLVASPAAVSVRGIGRWSGGKCGKVAHHGRGLFSRVGLNVGEGIAAEAVTPEGLHQQIGQLLAAKVV